jgi:RNA polymerase sigma factor (sigma-70 family)
MVRTRLHSSAMDYSTHASLLARLGEGVDANAWREFHDRYGELIIGFARRERLQPADCEDVLQEVLLALTRSMGKFEYDPSRGKFRSYLKTLAIRAVFRKRRQERRQATLGEYDGDAVDGDASLEARWEEEWRQYHVRLAMRRLEREFNERDRMAFARYAVKGVPASETADALGTNVDQVYQAKSRILRRLRELIAEQVEDEG